MGDPSCKLTHCLHLLGLKELCLEFFALGDVLCYTEHAGRLAGIVVIHLTLRVDRLLCAIRPDYPVVCAEGFALVYSVFYRFFHMVNVIGMDDAEEILV